MGLVVDDSGCLFLFILLYPYVPNSSSMASVTYMWKVMWYACGISCGVACMMWRAWEGRAACMGRSCGACRRS